MAGECLDVDDFQLLGLILDSPILFGVHQFVLKLSDPLLQALVIPLQVGMVLLIIFNGPVELSLLFPNNQVPIFPFRPLGRALVARQAFRELIALEGQALLVVLLIPIILVQCNLTFQLGDGVLQFLIFEFQGLIDNVKRILLLEQRIVCFFEFLLLDVGKGIHVVLAHHPQGIELVLDLLVGLDDLLDGFQGLLVFFLVIAHKSNVVITIQQQYSVIYA